MVTRCLAWHDIEVLTYVSYIICIFHLQLLSFGSRVSSDILFNFTFFLMCQFPQWHKENAIYSHVSKELCHISSFYCDVLSFHKVNICSLAAFHRYTVYSKATADKKNMWRHMEINPFICFLRNYKYCQWIKFTGKCRFIWGFQLTSKFP